MANIAHQEDIAHNETAEDRKREANLNRARAIVMSLIYVVALVVLANSSWFSTQSGWSKFGVISVLAVLPMAIIVVFKTRAEHNGMHPLH